MAKKCKTSLGALPKQGIYAVFGDKNLSWRGRFCYDALR